MIIVYITCKDEAEARSIARLLLEKRLIACANIFPIESMYFWNGALAAENEVVLIGKTVAEKYEHIIAEVTATHSYDIPCIVKIPIEANQAYLAWVKKEVC